MDNILYNIFKNIPDVPIPGDLHSRTMRSVAFSRLRNVIIFILSLACISLFVSIWHVYMRMSELDSLESVKVSLSLFEFNIDAIQDAFGVFIASLPTTAIMLTLLNIILTGLCIYAFSIFKKVQTSFSF